MGSQNEYFVPGDGIDRDVICADICRYLGNDAIVRPGTYTDPSTGRTHNGYFIMAFRNLTASDSERWNAEKRRVAEMETTRLQDWPHLPTLEHLVPTKKDLPLYLNGQPCRACADFGAAGNMISADFAIRSRIPFELDKTCPAFELPTFGRLVKPIGRARIECVFPAEPTSVGIYNFFVFENFVYPAIIGRKFLRDTETLDKHRHRLYDRPQQIHKIPIVAFIGAEEETLKFWLNGEELESTPDTGSEINVMSLDFALRREFPIVKDEFSQVRFADGSLQDIIGKVTIPVSFGSGSPPSILLKLVDSSSKSRQSIPSQPCGPNGEVDYGKTASILADFHILQGLNVDIILGEDLLATVNAFARYSGEFSPLTTPSSLYPGLGTIGLVKRLEKKLCEVRGKKAPQMDDDLMERDIADSKELDRYEKEVQRIQNLNGEEKVYAERMNERMRREYQRSRDAATRT